MTIRNADSKQLALRVLGALVISFVAFATLVPSTLAEAKGKEDRIGIFGTVIRPSDGSTVDVITRAGAVTLTIDNKTKIVTKRNGLDLDEVTSGDSVTGYYVEDDGENIAGKLTFLDDDRQITFEHIIGVITDSNNDTITVQTEDGDEVELPTPDDVDEEDIQEGSLVATAVEENSETGEMDVQALSSAEKTVEKLNDAIGNEVTLAQQKLLKIRVSETASAHLTKLYATLDEIKRESQEKIAAAFAEYEQNYKKAFDPADLENLRVVIHGAILTKTDTQLVVAAKGNGHRSYIIIPEGVEVLQVDGEPGLYSDLGTGVWVDVSAIPQTTTSSPIARSIQILETPESAKGNGKSKKNKNDQTITGTIVLVDDSEGETQQVIVIDDPEGGDEVAAITDETTITGDGDLEPGQEVEVTLGDDGFTADEVEVVESGDEQGTGSTEEGPTPTPAPPVEYKLSGKIRQILGDNIILDDVYLTLDNATTPVEPLSAGQELQFTVIVDDDGRWVVVGIDQ